MRVTARRGFLYGIYFVTVCVKNRKPILSNIIVGANNVRPKEIHLTKYGEIVETAIKNIPQHYPSIKIDNYVIMPDHIHLLLQINTDKNGRPMVAPTIDRVIKQTKGYIKKRIACGSVVQMIS